MPLSQAFDKKNVLVTGGAGFIGSHLCERLVHEQAHVICLDTFMNSSPSNIEHILTNQDFVFLNVDVNEPFDLESFPELEKFKVQFEGIQEIYHLACPYNENTFEQNRIAMMRSNSDGVQQVLNLAVKYQSKVVLGTSGTVYGERTSQKFQFSETDVGIIDQLSDRACYDEGMRFAETLGKTFGDVYRIDVKLARIFKTYGPRMKQDSGIMLTDMIMSALNGGAMKIYGEEDGKICLMFVSDVVDGLIKLMASGERVDAVNFGADYEFRLADIAQKIINITQSSSETVYAEPPKYIPNWGIPDLAKAKHEIGWFPLVTLDDGLRQTIDYMLANRGRLGIA